MRNVNVSWFSTSMRSSWWIQLYMNLFYHLSFHNIFHMVHGEVYDEENTCTSYRRQVHKITRRTTFSWTCFSEHGLSWTRNPNFSSPVNGLNFWQKSKILFWRILWAFEKFSKKFGSVSFRPLRSFKISEKSYVPFLRKTDN